MLEREMKIKKKLWENSTPLSHQSTIWGRSNLVKIQNIKCLLLKEENPPPNPNDDGDSFLELQGLWREEKN
jgi:hypothetical protein